MLEQLVRPHAPGADGRRAALRRAIETLLSRSEVSFRATTAAERVAYCRTGEPFDKAGGYGIQGHAAVFVEHLRGSYSARDGSAAVRDRGAARALPVSDSWLTATSGLDEARRNPDQRDAAARCERRSSRAACCRRC